MFFKYIYICLHILYINNRSLFVCVCADTSLYIYILYILYQSSGYHSLFGQSQKLQVLMVPYSLPFHLPPAAASHGTSSGIRSRRKSRASSARLRHRFSESSGEAPQLSSSAKWSERRSVRYPETNGQCGVLNVADLLICLLMIFFGMDDY